jgi:hypothetical protein
MKSESHFVFFASSLSMIPRHNVRHQPRRAQSPLRRRLHAMLAGSLKSEDPLPNSLRKVDEGELSFIEKVIVPALVDDPYKIVLGCSRIWQNSIDLAEDQRGFIPGILEA